MNNLYNTWTWRMIETKTRVHHLMDYFAVDENKAQEMLNDLKSVFTLEDSDEASDFLRFITNLEIKNDNKPNNFINKLEVRRSI